MPALNTKVIEGKVTQIYSCVRASINETSETMQRTLTCINNKHWASEHSEECKPGDLKFGFSVVKQHKSSFSRQTHEAILIYQGGANVMNSKSEFSRCKVPRLEVTFGDKLVSAAAPAVKTEEENEKQEPKRRGVQQESNLTNPVKRRRMRGQYSQGFKPMVTDIRAISEAGGMSAVFHPQHGQGGGQPGVQHHSGQGSQGGHDDRDTPSFYNIHPHHHDPRPTQTETKTSKGKITSYFKHKVATTISSSFPSKPNHPT